MEYGREDAELKDIKEQLLLYVKENERLVNELRNLRHGTLNIMQGINGYIELEDWDGLKEYFHDMLEEIKNTSNTNLSSIEKILNPLLKELLYSKLKMPPVQV
jgi:two-component system sensor histidine kinase AgrC